MSPIFLLRNNLDQYQLQPKCFIGDQAFVSWETFYNSLNIRPASVGRMTPWLSRAETAVCLVKRQVSLMLNSIKAASRMFVSAEASFASRRENDRNPSNKT